MKKPPDSVSPDATSPASSPDELADGPLLRLQEVERITSLHQATILRLVQRERFPTPVQLSERRYAWRRRDVRRWLAAPHDWVAF